MNANRNPRGIRRSAPIALTLGLILASGCATRSSLHDVVLDYDETVSRAQARMLLLNIARSKHQRPVHFTTVSGIAATIEYRTNAALGGNIAETPGISILAPSIGMSVAENPTISIVPIQGEEFTRRLLTPLDESILGFFYHHGIDPTLLLRLIVQSVVLEQEDGQRRVLRNPSAELDRVLARIRTAHERRLLDIGSLVFDETWQAAGPAPSARDLAALIDDGYRFESDGGESVLSRRVVGRQAVTNYDAAGLGNSARARLQQRAQQYPTYFVLLDLMPESEGEAPTRGWIKLRSVSAILEAVAAALRRGDSSSQVRVIESPEPVPDSFFTVPYEGRYYSLPRDASGQTQAGFRVLYRLFQMSVSKLPPAAVPAVTIAK